MKQIIMYIFLIANLVIGGFGAFTSQWQYILFAQTNITFYVIYNQVEDLKNNLYEEVDVNEGDDTDAE